MYVGPFVHRFSTLIRYVLARRSLLIAAAIQPDSLDIVLTRLLVSTHSLQLGVQMMNPCRALVF